MKKLFYLLSVSLLFLSCGGSSSSGNNYSSSNDEEYIEVELEEDEYEPTTEYVETLQDCSNCMGQGFFTCPKCAGNGVIPQFNDFTGYIEQVTCDGCLGRGGMPCPVCGGAKVVKVGSYQPTFKGNKHEGKLCSVKYPSGAYCNCSGCYGSSSNPKACIRCPHEVKYHNGH